MVLPMFSLRGICLFDKMIRLGPSANRKGLFYTRAILKKQDDVESNSFDSFEQCLKYIKVKG